ncbi:MAG TPA: LuxR C-terminal-related transcriptional regulator [Solirubrobacter sp.]|nr:LuxR C-terminal-related transcriptional regulator [Solirubrobacter sp.]
MRRWSPTCWRSATPSDAEQRIEALERTEAALARLSGPASELVQRAPAEAAAAVALDRVLLSRVDDGMLVPEAIHGGELPAPVALAYPLPEGQLLRRREPALIARDEPPERQAFGWRGYVVAPVVIGGQTVGFFHGDRDGPLTAVDEDALARFARGFAAIYERAVLLHRLRTQRVELRRIASWADARSVELTDGVIDLAHDREAPAVDRPAARLDDLLTPRETDVLEHMVRGESNADIARALVVSEGTVKFHVKNILRKLNVSNRAEATAHYLRHSLRD